MFAKVLSVSDELMWKYYLLLTDLTPAEIEKERGRGRPMDSTPALARRIAADFHGTALAAAAEAEWRRVHQARQAPSEMPEKTIAPGRHKWREVLVMAGFAPSNGAAERLLGQRGGEKGGVGVEGGELDAAAAQAFVVSVGAARFVRFRVEPA